MCWLSTRLLDSVRFIVTLIYGELARNNLQNLVNVTSKSYIWKIQKHYSCPSQFCATWTGDITAMNTGVYIAPYNIPWLFIGWFCIIWDLLSNEKHWWWLFYEFQNLNFGESSPSILRRRTGNFSVLNFNLIYKFQ